MDMSSVPPDLGAEFAALKSKVIASRKGEGFSSFNRLQATTPSRPDNCRRVAMMPQLIPAELELWLVDRQSELQEAMNLGEMRHSVGIDVCVVGRCRAHDGYVWTHGPMGSVKSRQTRYGLRVCRVGAASHPGPRVGQLPIGFIRLRPRRSRSRSPGVCGTVVDTSLIQDAQILSDREDDSLVSSGVVDQNESLEDFEDGAPKCQT